MTTRFVFVCLCGSVPIWAQPVPGRYIVELSSEPAAALSAARSVGFSSIEEGVVRRKAEIAAEHAVMEQSIRSLGGVVRGRLDTLVNAMSVELTEEAAARMREMPGVRGVYPDVKVEKHLDHALSVHKIPDSWSRIPGGQAGAGAGIKIGIVDTGIDSSHPAFQGFGTAIPAGFPKFSSPAEKANTNNKVIVSRDYSGAGGVDTDGHGTGNAMVAAGLRYDPAAYGISPFSGFAPGAWLGNYAAFGGNATTFTLMQAVQDAVSDGMNVVNMSGGFPATSGSDEVGPFSRTIDAAFAAGTLVVVSAGNAGPDAGTIGAPAVTANTIAVGANTNERIFADGVALADLAPFVAVAGTSSVTITTLIRAPMVDVTPVDGNGFGCSPFPAGSLSGKIALISRGGVPAACAFDDKVNNAQNAGAVGVVVYDNKPDEFVGMSLPTATLAAAFVTQDSGQQMRQKLAALPGAVGVLDLSSSTPLPLSSDLIPSFSAGGPTPRGGIKPDLMAVGFDVATANTTQGNSTPWQITAGTSLSAPMVTGALAALMSARPGLTAAQYRSLIVDTGTPFVGTSGKAAPPQIVGGGKLNLLQALQNNSTADPASVSFFTASGTVDVTRNVVVANVGSTTDTFTIATNALNASGPVPTVDAPSFTLEPGASKTVAVRITIANPDPGQYQGYLQISGTKTSVSTTVPYWLGVPGATVKGFAFLTQYDFVGALPGDPVGIYFRTTDLNGLPLDAGTPTVITTSPRARVTRVIPAGDIPGTYRADVVMGRADSKGVNVFTFAAGDATRDLTFVIE